MPFQFGHPRYSGRKPGTKDRLTTAREAKCLQSGQSPIEVLVSLYRNEAEPMNLRLDAARTVANLVYPRLSSVDLNAHNDQPTVVQIVRFSDMPIADRRTEDRLIDLAPDGTVTDAIAVARDDGEAEEATA